MDCDPNECEIVFIHKGGKSRKTSFVWDYYGQLKCKNKIQTPDKYYCSVCLKDEKKLKAVCNGF